MPTTLNLRSEIVVTLPNSRAARILTRGLQISDESGCPLTDAIERATYEDAHNLLPQLSTLAVQDVNLV